MSGEPQNSGLQQQKQKVQPMLCAAIAQAPKHLSVSLSQLTRPDHHPHPPPPTRSAKSSRLINASKSEIGIVSTSILDTTLKQLRLQLQITTWKEHVCWDIVAHGLQTYQTKKGAYSCVLILWISIHRSPKIPSKNLSNWPAVTPTSPRRSVISSSTPEDRCCLA